MNKGHKVVKTTEQLIRERKEKRRLKTDRFIAKLEKLEKAKELALNQPETIPVRPAPAGRQNTLSIALPCSIIDNCQSLELKCYLASMIARCASIFSVDEIVVFNDTKTAIPVTPTGEYALMGKRSHSALTLASILQYLECPPHLRKFFFPHKKEFDLAAQMNPLDIPHHRPEEVSLYREGVVSKTTPKPGKGSYVYVGLHREVQVDRLLEEGVRVTVKMEPAQHGQQKKLRGTIVSPSTPRLESSIYWGYSVRLAKSFAQVLSGSPFDSLYDLTVGTSERGTSVDDIKKLKPFQHALIAFGGLQGLEAITEADEELPGSDASALFQLYLNTCPSQGSRTIRTEEALFISLTALQAKFA